MVQVCMNYGGGRQTVAMCLLIAKEAIPKPDRIVIADTSRENPMTWEYLEEYTQPLMKELGLEIEIASHDFATVDLYSHQGTLLIPAFTKTGKFSSYCSGEWKRDVVERHLKRSGMKKGITLLGLSYDEKPRWKRAIEKERHGFTVACPLVDLMLTTDDCKTVIERHGWPLPHRSSCYMCPHKTNAEWAHIRDNYPEEWNEAIDVDHEVRDHDDRGEIWLHKDRVPLSEADLTVVEKPDQIRQCSLGLCFV